MDDLERSGLVGAELSDRERKVLEAVVRTYVDTAEPTGSRTVSRGFGLGVSAATVRNTMSDLEEKGYLFHPHTSAGRVPTDLAYRFFVDRLMEPRILTQEQRVSLERELDVAGGSAVERLVRQATRALSLLSNELGVAVAPRLDEAILEKLEFIQVSTNKVVLVASIRGGVVRTVYVDLPGEVPQDTLIRVTLALNERLAGLSLPEIRRTLPERLRDSHVGEDGAAELLNIFVQSGAELFDLQELDSAKIHLGHASVLAAQPEFESGDRLKSLIELTEQRDLLAQTVGNREHRGRVMITIGGENATSELADFTLVTAEYRAGDLSGVIGVIGPTRMPYEKVVTIVDYTSSLVTRMLQS
ncbi:MAG: heat-inducible transcription repressor HrcA [Gemmatimonadales bacterium]|jgi:heat-inducible transcriptional repressor|nr:heat-inducible transcription repressor HrcA [Gemmatimonadales bacterium]MDG2240179.1 heat-inducible transcriptional repressor HrcA [Longimicrobiales bacterium]MBT3499440.1 heat-inducible transcription repressor HrcA [Gemmatimonadales bacterium]MBT3958232.1 heat-inducible transcription repressor HrcA [Gemmatimonadales bacterium]MBT4437387.1 heat-inducible transcription repressor HrcA [Gemmatimonadales bacterium]